MDRYTVEDKPTCGSYAIWDREQQGWKVVEVFVWYMTDKEEARKLAAAICDLLNRGTTEPTETPSQPADKHVPPTEELARQHYVAHKQDEIAEEYDESQSHRYR